MRGKGLRRFVRVAMERDRWPLIRVLEVETKCPRGWGDETTRQRHNEVKRRRRAVPHPPVFCAKSAEDFEKKRVVIFGSAEKFKRVQKSGKNVKTKRYRASGTVWVLGKGRRDGRVAEAKQRLLSPPRLIYCNRSVLVVKYKL